MPLAARDQGGALFAATFAFQSFALALRLTMIVLQITLMLLMISLVSGSLLNLSSHSHWFVRGWDFPRVQIIASGWVLTLTDGLIRYFGSHDQLLSSAWFLVSSVALTLWHGFFIAPYTLLYSKQAKSTARETRPRHDNDASTIRVVLSNVEQENEQFDRWLSVVDKANPDILIAVEIDQRWIEASQSLFERYPHRILHPQDNWYGMMILSRLPIVQYQLRFLIQDDVPSIDAEKQLDDGTLTRVIAVHPRPPEPLRGNDATA